MKQILFIVLTASTLSLTAHANSVDFTNEGGSLSGGSAGISVIGSMLIGVNGLNGVGITTGNLGSVWFSTAGLTFGSLQTGASFSAGGTFFIDGNGTNGVHNGVIFSGTFSSPVTWTMLTAADRTHYYSLSGNITGTWFDGSTVNGAFVVLTLSTGTRFYDGSVTLGSGNSVITLNSVPEPGTLGLVGTGLVGVIGALTLQITRRGTENIQS